MRRRLQASGIVDFDWTREFRYSAETGIRGARTKVEVIHNPPLRLDKRDWTR